MIVPKPDGDAVRSDSTRFKADEDPLSEGGIWLWAGATAAIGQTSK